MNEQKNAVCVDHICKSYGKKEVLQDISFAIPEGSIFGLVGPSGCGKSTTVKIIAGLLSPDSGSVSILEEKMPNLSLLSQIGYMAQSTALYEMLSAKENLEFFGSLYGLKGKDLQKRMNYVMNLIALSDDLKKSVSAYSGGMKRRLSLAVSLLSNPKILLLDEPTVGIDPVLRQSIWQELRALTAEGITILITTHVMDEAEKCSGLAMIREGKLIASDTPEQIIAKSGAENLEDAYIYFSTMQGNGGAI